MRLIAIEGGIEGLGQNICLHPRPRQAEPEDHPSPLSPPPPQPPGSNEAIREREELVNKMTAHPPKFFKSRVKRNPLVLSTVVEVAKETALRAKQGVTDDAGSTATSATSAAPLGWISYPAGAPSTQTMSRDEVDVEQADLLHGPDGKPDWQALGTELHAALPPLQRAWSVAY